MDYGDENFQALRHLVAIDDRDAEFIARVLTLYPERIQLVDLTEKIGLSSEVAELIRLRQSMLVPDSRKPFLEKYDQTVRVMPSLEQSLSRVKLNPFTQFENAPPLLFGMGGGSRALNKGFPIDILSMVLTAEKLRRQLGLGRCRVICANGITYTNIPRKPDEFSKESIDRVMSAERDLLQLVVDRFGIADHWDIFLETDIKQVIGEELKEQYDMMIEDADAVPFIGGHHYSIEMAQMYTLLNQDRGGVKLGWFMRNLSKTKAEYIMDEQPFDARYAMYLAYRGLTNKISIPYIHAGVKLYPGLNRAFNKEAPYICYNPKDRILLRPTEDPERKLIEATNAGGGLNFREIRRHYGSLVKLFEEIVITASIADRRVRVDDFLELETENGRRSKVGQRIKYILDFIFEGDREEAEKMYKAAFPRS